MAYSIYGDHKMVIIKDGCTKPVFETTDPQAAIIELSRLNRQGVNAFSTPSRIDARFEARAQRNGMGQFNYDFYSNGQWVMSMGMEHYGYNEFTAQIEVDALAKKILDRIKAGKPYKVGDMGNATKFLG